MGLSYRIDPQSKADLAAELIQQTGDKCLAHRLVGNELWMVIDTKDPEYGTIITLDVLERVGAGYGYRDMAECMGPCYYGCPLEFLDMAPVANAEWRADVLARHAERILEIDPTERFKVSYQRNGKTRTRYFATLEAAKKAADDVLRRSGVLGIEQEKDAGIFPKNRLFPLDDVATL